MESENSTANEPFVKALANIILINKEYVSHSFLISNYFNKENCELIRSFIRMFATLL